MTLLEEMILILNRNGINVQILKDETEKKAIAKIHRNISILMNDTSKITEAEKHIIYDFILIYNKEFPNLPSPHLDTPLLKEFKKKLSQIP